jgi:uncharacterized protein YciI
MEHLKRLLLSGIFIGALFACSEAPKAPEEPGSPPLNAENQGESKAELRQRLESEGYQLFDYVDAKTGDTVLMQQYFIAFLKSGPVRSQSPEEADSLQALHLAHLARMYGEGYADISGPFGDEGEIRGITIYNVPTLAMADSLANLDPSVRAGRLVIEVHPWWAAKGFPLR